MLADHLLYRKQIEINIYLLKYTLFIYLKAFHIYKLIILGTAIIEINILL